jgi:hypothetical protein
MAVWKVTGQAKFRRDVPGPEDRDGNSTTLYSETITRSRDEILRAGSYDDAKAEGSERIVAAMGTPEAQAMALGAEVVGYRITVRAVEP